MKITMFVCLLMLSGTSVCLGSSDCRIVPYPDHTEVVCIGEDPVTQASIVSAAGIINAGTLPMVAMIDGKGTYATAQDAYDAATDNDLIRITGATIPGPLLAANPSLAVVNYTGGCDSAFQPVYGQTTTILGTVFVRSSRVNVIAIKVRPGLAAGPLPVNLRTAGNFVILTKTGVTTTGNTVVTGDVGVSPIAATALTGFALTADTTNTFSTSPVVVGRVYAADYASPTPALLTAAVSDMETAYTDAAGRTLPDYTDLGTGDISGMTLAPGLYKWSTGVVITNAGVTLSGGADDVWIFQIAQDLTVGNDAIITLTGGAQAKNIFWQVSGQATLGTAADFKGIILSQTLISFANGARMSGRALAQTAVTLDANAITVP
jgi:hypothetical protein